VLDEAKVVVVGSDRQEEELLQTVEVDLVP